MINRQIGRREDEQGEAQGKSSHPFGSYVLHLPSFATSINILSMDRSLGACLDIGFFIIARKVAGGILENIVEHRTRLSFFVECFVK